MSMVDMGGDTRESPCKVSGDVGLPKIICAPMMLAVRTGHHWKAAFLAVALMPSSAASPATVPALDLLQSVPVVLEHRGGYDRSLFDVWLDADHDGCDTRSEVLRRDSSVAVRVTSHGCTVIDGAWVSAYDGVATTDPSQLEIDHVVALKEAWDSGAWSWTPARRAAFANDLSDPRTLREVTIAANRAKGDRDPSNWLPVAADQCRFLGDWVAIKARWGLSADPSEWGRIRNVLRSRCPGLMVTAPTAPTLAGQAQRALVAPIAPGTTSGTPTGASPYYPRCADARAAGVAPLRRGDPGYRSALDGDDDGVACEG